MWLKFSQDIRFLLLFLPWMIIAWGFFLAKVVKCFLWVCKVAWIVTEQYWCGTETFWWCVVHEASGSIVLESFWWWHFLDLLCCSIELSIEFLQISKRTTHNLNKFLILSNRICLNIQLTQLYETFQCLKSLLEIMHLIVVNLKDF